MHYRPLGKTGLTVSEIGYGAWGIGGSVWIGAQEDESVRALHRAIELGVNFIDTARGYGESERIVGRVVRGSTADDARRDQGPAEEPDMAGAGRPGPGRDVPRRAHPGEPGDEPAPLPAWRHSTCCSSTSGAMSGWAGATGWRRSRTSAGGQDPVLRRLDQRLPAGQRPRAGQQRHLDTVQVIYNAFHQAPEERLLPACAQHGVGVIVRVALDEGGLTGRITADTTFPEGDFRNSYFGGDRQAQVEQHVDALVATSASNPTSSPSVALRYVLEPGRGSTVIAGMRTVRNVERNAAVSDGRGLSAEQQAIVAKHRWERNFYES